MFTGIITNIGIVSSIKKIGNATVIKIKSPEVVNQLKLGESIAVNGVCLTVINKIKNQFEVEAVEETIKKTTFKYLEQGEEVNLELALTVSDRLNGHIVQGHVDCVGTIKSLKKLTKSWIINIQIPDENKVNIVKVGSIAIDGISLTISDVTDNCFDVSIIPYTMMHTILKNKKPGSKVNVEFDIIGKYIVNYLNGLLQNKPESKITLEKLKKLGF
ncbi:MAG: Riboflavin synthase eubacterial/eukaryotic [Ignavibacteriae bacterium]|nr:MAG: Riboflavin synthase eubacterial/eukaryotic [Ignavibacteriota bacterium]